MDKRRGGGRLNASDKSPHALGVLCVGVLRSITNKTHSLVFIFSQSFAIDYMSRDLWHYEELP